MPSRKTLTILAAAWTLLIMALLSIPGSSLPSTKLLEFDKLAHAGLFFILGFLWLFALADGKLMRALLVLGVILAFSFASEWYQQLLPFERTADLMDAVADSVGALLSFVFWALYTAKQRGRQQ